MLHPERESPDLTAKILAMLLLSYDVVQDHGQENAVICEQTHRNAHHTHQFFEWRTLVMPQRILDEGVHVSRRQFDGVEEHLLLIVKILVNRCPGNPTAVSNLLVRYSSVPLLCEERKGFRQYLDSPLMMIDCGGHSIVECSFYAFFLPLASYFTEEQIEGFVC